MKKATVRILAILIVLSSPVFACTDFTVKAKDGTVVNGRSMEFPVDMKSEVAAVPRGISRTCRDYAGNEGLSWTTKYGFMAVNVFGARDCYVDGFNEKGLSVGGLMYTGAQYQEPAAGKSIPLENVSEWILGNFATADEVIKALPQVHICDSAYKPLKGMGLHLILHDTAGKSVVIEFIGGRANVYDNPIGVMTNRPDFPWQLTNLRNYVNLDAQDVDSKEINGTKFLSTGAGSGLRGLPGDWTPPSRFVRIALSKDAALKPRNAAEAVNLAQHLLNVVDIPKGVIREKPVMGQSMYGFAQWVLVKDITNRQMYFKTYEDPSWKMADLKKFDLNAGSPARYISVSCPGPAVTDISGMMK